MKNKLFGSKVDENSEQSAAALSESPEATVVTMDTDKKHSGTGSGKNADTGYHFNVAEELRKPAPTKTVLKQVLRENRLFVDGDDKEAKIGISAYKNLRTRVTLRMDELGTNCIMVAGTAQNVGKTLTSINLALALSRRSSKRVVLVDMDLRSPSVHHLFGFESKGNIVDVAEGKIALSKVLVDPQINNLSVLPGSVRVEDSSEAMVSENMLALLEEFKAQQDTIFVFDTPPVLGCDDVAAIAPYIQACLFVVSERATSKKELGDALQIMGDTTEIVGVTINRSSEGNFDSYYY